MTHELRLLTEADTDAFWAVRLEALELEPRSFGESAEEHRATPWETVAARVRASSPQRNFILGAFAGPQLVGTAGFYRMPNKKEFHRGHVWGVYVNAAHRGRGLARRLMVELLRIAKAQPGLELIKLSVASHNTAAKQLYASLGFRAYGHDVHATKMGETYVDEDLMVLHCVNTQESSD